MKAYLFLNKRLHGYRFHAAAALILALLEGLAMGWIPFSVGKLIVVIIFEEGPQKAVFWGMGIPVAAVVRLYALRWSWICSFSAGNILTERLRSELVEHMTRVPLGVIHQFGPARLASLVSEDGRWINEVSTFTLTRVVATLASASALFVLLATLSPALALGVAIAGVGAAAWAPVGSRVLAKLIALRNVEIADATRRIGEYVQGITVFRTYRSSQAAFDRLQSSVRSLHYLMKSQSAKQVVMAQINAGIWALCLPLGLYLILMSAPGIVVTDAYWFIPSLLLLLNLRNSVANGALRPMVVLGLAARAVRNIGDFLDQTSLSGQSPKFTKKPGSLDLSMVSFAYEGRGSKALRDVSFRATQGLTAVVGPSGSGKSTIISLLLRYYDPTSGSVYIGGAKLAATDPNETQKLVSYVGQDIHILDGSLRENLLLGNPQASEREMEQALTHSSLEDLYTSLPEGLETKLGAGGRKLSGGERQRVALARALLKNAPILLLDEATSAVDPLTELAIARMVRKISKDVTVVAVAHRLATIKDADQILVLNNGSIAEFGTHDELVSKSGLYHSLWSRQHQMEGWKIR